MRAAGNDRYAFLWWHASKKGEKGPLAGAYHAAGLGGQTTFLALEFAP